MPLRIREYTEADLDALRRMHSAQGFDYEFPNIADPIFVLRLVLEDDAGSPAMAILSRLTAEAYLLADSAAGTPRERWERFVAIHRAAERALFARGLDDVHAWLPPRIARSFGRRLERLGWVRDAAWMPYCLRLAPPNSRMPG